MEAKEFGENRIWLGMRKERKKDRTDGQSALRSYALARSNGCMASSSDVHSESRMSR
jgi:hypothetical protein